MIVRMVRDCEDIILINRLRCVVRHRNLDRTTCRLSLAHLESRVAAVELAQSGARIGETNALSKLLERVKTPPVIRNRDESEQIVATAADLYNQPAAALAIEPV